MITEYYKTFMDEILEYIKCEEEWIVASRKWKERQAKQKKSKVD